MRTIAWVFLASLAAAVFFAGWHGARVAMLVGATLVVAWVTAVVLIQTDYRGAIGFMDCWPSCTALEVMVSFALFYSPVLLVVLLLGRLAGWMTRRGSG